MDINKEVRNLLINKKIYFKFIKHKKIKYEKNYHGIVIDPDGRRRNLLKERIFKLKQFNNLDYPAKPRWSLDESAKFLKGAGIKL